MNKVLFIAYHFPPCESIGGALRSDKFAKYLPEFGWDPIILTIKNKNYTYTYNKNIIRFPSLTPYFRPYNLTPYGWAWNLYKHAKKIILKKKIKLIYVTCPPYAPAITALLLKKRHCLPLIVDYRDAWTLNPLADLNLAGRVMNQLIFPVIENKVLLGADILITNTPSMLTTYSNHIPALKNKIELIPNGFDEEDFAETPEKNVNKEMTFLHCGRFGVSGRNPELLFNSFKELSKLGYRLKFNLLGEDSLTLKKVVESLGVEKIVNITGQVKHEEAIKQMYDADVLVIYQNESKLTAISAIAGKTFEYLRIGKPILVIAPTGDNSNIIMKYASRYEAVSNYTEKDITEAISSLYKDWEEGIMPSKQATFQDYVKKFNRRALTKNLAELFSSLI